MLPIISYVMSVLGSLTRVIGMLVLGYAVARLALDMYRKGIQTWQFQAVVFLGFVGLAVGLARFTGAGSMGGFGLGAGAALLMGLNPKKDEKVESS
jgi:hypothetical protein